MVESSKGNVYIKVKDHSVSGEDFELVINDDLGMLETFPKPPTEKLPEYYKSSDYISHTDGRRNFFEKTYQFIKGIALNKKLKLIDSIARHPKSLLDIGCGTGDFLQAASNAGWTITGIEPNLQARTIANKKTKGLVFDSEQLSEFETKSFDVITLWHVLEHLPDLDRNLSIFKNILRADGFLIIAVPNYKSHDAQFYKEFWAAFDVPRHLWHFSQDSLKKLVTTLDMKVVETIPMKFDAFYVSLLSEKYKTGKMNYAKGFWNGVLSNLKAKRSGEYSSLIYVIKKA